MYTRDSTMAMNFVNYLRRKKFELNFIFFILFAYRNNQSTFQYKTY